MNLNLKASLVPLLYVVPSDVRKWAPCKRGLGGNSRANQFAGAFRRFDIRPRVGDSLSCRREAGWPSLHAVALIGYRIFASRVQGPCVCSSVLGPRVGVVSTIGSKARLVNLPFWVHFGHLDAESLRLSCLADHRW